jgi:hypothetical protein
MNDNHVNYLSPNSARHGIVGMKLVLLHFLHSPIYSYQYQIVVYFIGMSHFVSDMQLHLTRRFDRQFQEMSVQNGCMKRLYSPMAILS